jgi:hypothetical protein
MDIGLSRAQLVELMNALDADRDGRIQFSEFAARFRLLFSKFQDDEAAGAATSLHALTVSDGGVTPAGGSGARTPGAGGSAAAGASGRVSPSLIVVDAWTREALGRVGDALFSNGGGDLQEAFKLLDSNRDAARRRFTDYALRPPRERRKLGWRRLRGAVHRHGPQLAAGRDRADRGHAV